MGSKSSYSRTVLDLFSGAGGASFGFSAHEDYEIVAAVDSEVGKPSQGGLSLECNKSYEQNIGVRPFNRDLSTLSPKEFEDQIEESNPQGARAIQKHGLDVLISCAPCTGFSRTKNANHLIDDPKNLLVPRSALFVDYFKPSVFVMENARELITGRFRQHFATLRSSLEEIGYRVAGDVHFLHEFGLPQKRERALVIGVRKDLPLRTLRDLWQGVGVRSEAVTVRRAISSLPQLESGQVHKDDPMHACPANNERTLARLRAIPHDGGSWADLAKDHSHLLNPAMKRYIAAGKWGSHPDVYGRLWWDKPSVTIKRECAHVGNGRYSHPEQDRLLSVREMAVLQGFPADYEFVSSNFSNKYRHIGDSVPPLISYQIAHLASWILTGNRPSYEQLLLPNTHLKVDDLDESASATSISEEFQPALALGSLDMGLRPGRDQEVLLRRQGISGVKHYADESQVGRSRDRDRQRRTAVHR